MNVRQILKRSDTMVGLVRDARRVMKLPDAIRHGRTIRNYLSTPGRKRLQIGAGPTLLDGWLSTDIAPRSHSVVFLDATKPFPFEKGVFDCVYSEHMIEHISWEDGQFMLRECKRILKPGGTLRLATPDLEVLLGLYTASHGSPAADKYIKWITDTFLDEVRVYDPRFVINNAFKNWGHQFLYDGKLMEMALREAGFASIRRCRPGESEHSDLRGIESHGRNIADEEMAAFETMVFEADCPA